MAERNGSTLYVTETECAVFREANAERVNCIHNKLDVMAAQQEIYLRLGRYILASIVTGFTAVVGALLANIFL